jgi:hypothetical protein
LGSAEKWIVRDKDETFAKPCKHMQNAASDKYGQPLSSDSDSDGTGDECIVAGGTRESKVRIQLKNVDEEYEMVKPKDLDASWYRRLNDQGRPIITQMDHDAVQKLQQFEQESLKNPKWHPSSIDYDIKRLLLTHRTKRCRRLLRRYLCLPKE